HAHNSDSLFFFSTPPAPSDSYTLSLRDALPISPQVADGRRGKRLHQLVVPRRLPRVRVHVAAESVLVPLRPRVRVPVEIEMDLRSEEHTSELQSPDHLVCRLLPEKKKSQIKHMR